MSDPSQLQELIRLGREQRVLEYKRSCPFNNIKEKIIRTALAMANCRDGGTVIVGVEELTRGVFVPKGVTTGHLPTYDSDQIQESINQYADPYVRADVHRVEMDGETFIAIVIHEFDQIPVICKKDGSELRQGAVYTRSHRKPETCEVRSQTEMREIIELAVDKGVRAFERRIRAVGARLELTESDAERFKKQLGDL